MLSVSPSAAKEVLPAAKDEKSGSLQRRVSTRVLDMLRFLIEAALRQFCRIFGISKADVQLTLEPKLQLGSDQSAGACVIKSADVPVMHDPAQEVEILSQQPIMSLQELITLIENPEKRNRCSIFLKFQRELVSLAKKNDLCLANAVDSDVMSLANIGPDGVVSINLETVHSVCAELDGLPEECAKDVLNSIVVEICIVGGRVKVQTQRELILFRYRNQASLSLSERNWLEALIRIFRCTQSQEEVDLLQAQAHAAKCRQELSEYRLGKERAEVSRKWVRVQNMVTPSCEIA
ncbi:MAG: hypothetical protein LBI34_02530 [Puniceicoccales bacterium]|jgi:hypothetical protein|nr:hypothetical protein [Puniceicoccales bacterium]